MTKITLKDLVLFNFKLGGKRAMGGIGYWRAREYPITLEKLNLRGNLLVLDLGSGISPLPLLLVHHGCTVYATDTNYSVFTQLKYAERIGLKDLVNKKKFVVERQDAGDLSYPDEFFDRVTFISVVEHLPENHDIKAMKEIGRVLRTEGIAIVTTTFASRYYSGRYNRKTIIERLVKPSGLKLKEEIYFEEVIPFIKAWRSLPMLLKLPFLWLQPLFASIFLRQSERASDKTCIACLVLENTMDVRRVFSEPAREESKNRIAHCSWDDVNEKKECSYAPI